MPHNDPHYINPTKKTGWTKSQTLVVAITNKDKRDGSFCLSKKFIEIATNRKIQTLDATKSGVNYAYDLAGRITETTDAKKTKSSTRITSWINSVKLLAKQGKKYRGDGLNLYAYYANKPVVYYDPSGYAAEGSKDALTRRELAKKKLDEAAKGTKGNANGEADFLYADGVIVPRNAGYKNFNELKKNLPHIKQEIPVPGRGNYHHIIEENPTNLAKYSPEFIHNKQNIVPLDSAKGAVHGKVSGYYSSKDPGLFRAGTVRPYVNQLPANEQV